MITARSLQCAVLLATIAGSTAAQGQGGAARPPTLASCAACHGDDGLSRMPDAPHLAAQPAMYLERALRAYRSGERRHEVMNVVAKPLSDADIAALAAWYSAVIIEVKPPR